MTKENAVVTIMPPRSGDKDKSEFFLRARQIGILTSIPLILALGPLIGYFAGSWIDRKFGFYPVGTLALIGLGFAASVRETVRMIREALRNN